MKRINASLLSLLLSLGLGSAAIAEEASAAQPGATASPAETANYQFNDQELEKFAAVQQELEVIREEYGAKLENVEDPKKAQSLQQEASETMTEAVTDEGLDVETYSTIAKAVRNDDALRQRVIEMMN